MNKTRISTLTTSTQYCTGGSRVQQGKKKSKGIQVGKEEIKVSLFADDMTVSVENPVESTKKLPKLVS